MSKMYKPTGAPDLIPYLTVRNTRASMKFYKAAFGFEVMQLGNDENQEPAHVEMKRENVIIMFCHEGAFGNVNKAPITQNMQMPLTIYIYCTDVDQLYNQAVNAGAISKLAPTNGFWGDRFCALIDIDGYEWSFATHIDDPDLVTKH